MITTTKAARAAVLAAALSVLMACSPSNLPEPQSPTSTAPSVSTTSAASSETSSLATVTVTATPPPVTVKPTATVTEQTTEQQTATATTEPPTETTRTGEPIETATVKSVHDGDTFTLTTGEKVRVLGIDAPEIPPAGQNCYGQEAAQEAQRILTGQPVTLQGDPRQGDTDRYGRLLRYVGTTGGDFADLMLAGGYARVYVAYPVARTPEYQQQQDQAYAQGAGLWSACGE